MFMFTWPRPNQEKEPDAEQDSIGAEGNGIRRDEIHDDVDEETDRGDLTFVAQITMNIFAAFAFLLLSFFAIFTNDYGVSAVVKSSKAATTVFKGSVEHRSGESTPADQTKLLAGAPKDKADDLDAGILGKPGVAAVTNRASISNFRGGKGHDDDGPKITMNGRALKETSQSSLARILQSSTRCFRMGERGVRSRSRAEIATIGDESSDAVFRILDHDREEVFWRRVHAAAAAAVPSRAFCSRSSPSSPRRSTFFF